MKDIYLLFTRTPSLVSSAIKLFTDMPYTHVSLCLDLNSNEFYSFARKYQYLVLPGGFVTEHLNQGNLKRFEHNPCALYKIRISEKKYNTLKQNINYMLEHNDYEYNFLGVLSFYLGIPLERNKHYFCSEFVSDALNQAGVIQLKKSRALYSPSDLLELSKLEPVYTGSICNLSKQLIVNKNVLAQS